MNLLAESFLLLCPTGNFSNVLPLPLCQCKVGKVALKIINWKEREREKSTGPRQEHAEIFEEAEGKHKGFELS